MKNKNNDKSNDINNITIKKDRAIIIPFLIYSCITLFMVVFVFVWTIIDDVLEFEDADPEEFKFGWNDFWISFIISQTLATVLEIFLLVCFFLRGNHRLHVIFDSTIALVDLYSLQIIWTIWASILFASGIHKFIPLTMYSFIILTSMLYMVKTMHSANKNKKTLSAIIMILEKSDPKNKEKFEEIYDDINDIDKVKIKKLEKRLENARTKYTKQHEIEESLTIYDKKIDNGKTKKIEL